MEFCFFFFSCDVVIMSLIFDSPGPALQHEKEILVKERNDSNSLASWVVCDDNISENDYLQINYIAVNKSFIVSTTIIF